MKLSNEIGHMVSTVEMWWLRTTLAIFRGAVWAETCCCVQRCDVFKAGGDLHLHRLSQRDLSSVFSTSHFCNYRSPLRPMQGSLLSSHGWFTLLISRSHRSWPWGRTAAVTTTSWPTLWVIIRLLPGGGQDLSYSACALTLKLHALYLSYRLLCFKKKHHIFPFYHFIIIVFVHQSWCGRQTELCFS